MKNYLNLRYTSDETDQEAKSNFLIHNDIFKKTDEAQELIISRFSISNNAPSFIWPGDTDEMDITMTNEDQTQSASVKLVYTAFHDLTGDRYYHMYSIGNFLKIVNDGLIECLEALKLLDVAIVGDAPYFFMDGNKINYSIQDPANYRFYFSKLLGIYFENHKVKISDVDLIHKEFLHEPIVTMEAEYDNLEVLLPYKRIEVHSTLNINNEYFVITGNSKIDSEYLLTDFLLDEFDNPHQIKRLSYINVNETRGIVLQDTKNLRDFSVSFYFITKDNKRVPVKMDNGDEFTLKLLFKKSV